MQAVNAALQTALDKGQIDPRVFVDLLEFYSSDAVPGATGFDPADAEETLAGSEITYNSIAYRRSVIDRSAISRSMGEKTNSVTITFSNIDRYVATWAQTAPIEGKIIVIRCVNPDVTDDSMVLFAGRCDKPGDIDKKSFSLSARQDFGNINTTLPTSQFVAEDPNGRLPGDPLYEGFRFTAQSGTFQTSSGNSGVLGAILGGIVGFLLTRKKATTMQWSSLDSTPYGSVVPEVFGTCQMPGIPMVFQDRGNFSLGLWVWCKGPNQSISEFSIRSPGYTMFGLQVNHLGDLGGTGTNAIEDTAHSPGIGYFSLTAYSTAGFLSDLTVVDEAPVVTALIQGRKIDLPDGSGVYNRSEWSDNPVHISRFILTNERFANINPAFMDDAVNYLTGLHCDEPLIDLSNSQMILIPAIETAQAGTSFKRYQTAGLYTPESVKYFSGDLTEELPDPTDGPYTPVPDFPDPIPSSFDVVPVLLKRYTANFPITETVKAVDLVHKNVFPTAKLFMKVGKNAKVGIYSEKASDSTKVRIATVVGATAIPVLDVTPWKTGPYLLTGRVLTGWSLTTSEVRDLLSAEYSDSGNAVTLTTGNTGTTTLAASGATLSGGSTSVQASGTLTVGGTPAPEDTISAIIDGVTVTYTLTATDDTETAAAMLMNLINATATLKTFIRASWLAASPTVITITCLHGTLNLTSATGFPTLLKAHDADEEVMRIAMSFATNSQDVFSSWKPSTLVLLNDVWLPDPLNGHKYQATSITTGITGTSHPTMPTTAGGTVVDGGVTWSEIGSTVLAQAGLKRANIVKDSFKWPLGSTQSSVNQIKGKFRNKALDFVEQPFIVNDSAHQAQVKKIYPKEVDYTAVDNWHQAYRLAKAELAKNREGDWFAALEAGPSALVLEEGDLIAVSDDSGGLINVVTRIEDLKIKANHHVVIERSRLYSTTMFSDDVAVVPIVIPSTLRYIQTVDSIAAFIDNFALRDADALIPGFYIAVSRDIGLIGDWRGWQLYADYGDGYVALPGASGDIAATMGTADTILGSVSDPAVFDTIQTFTSDFTTDILTVAGHVFANGNSVRVSNSGGALPAPLAANTTYFVRDVSGDTFKLAATSGGAAIDLITDNGTGTHSIRNVLTFTLKYGTPSPAPDPFATVTEADLVANPYKNLFLVGDEYLQAATIVSNGSQSFTVSDFFRGRFGTDSTQLVHGASEDVVFLNGAEKFVAIDPARAGIAYNYKVVTTNQSVADATPISFTWTGGTGRPRHPTNLSAVLDDSGNWYISATGNPRASEIPESYMVRIRRVSDGVTMRDMPISLGINYAAIFTPVSGVPTYATISNNNVYGVAPFDTSIGSVRTVQSLTPGVAINTVITVPAGGIAKISAGALIPDAGAKWGVIVFYLDANTTRLNYYDWTGAFAGFQDIPTVGGVIYLRIALVGTQIRFQFGGSPITTTRPPDKVLTDSGTLTYPTYLYIGVTRIVTKVEKVTIGGMNYPQTIYSLGQQENDNGSAMTTIDAEMWQVSRYPGVVGASVRGVFP